MAEAGTRQICLNCQRRFTPDSRARDRQRFCSRPACKKASKVWRQKRWRAKAENQDYWRGPTEVERVRQWRKKHPGYWRHHVRKGRVRYKTT